MNTPDPFIDLTRIASNAREQNITASTAPFWGDSPQTWDTIYFDNQRMPGIVKVKGHVGRRCDKKKSPGLNGTTVTFLGEDPAEFSVSFILWTDEHLRGYRAIVEYLRANSKVTKVIPAKEKQKLLALPSTRVVGARKVIGKDAAGNDILEDEGDFSSRSTFTLLNGGQGFGGSAFADLRKSLEKTNVEKPGRKVSFMRPVSVIHPALNILNITACYVVDYGMLEPAGEGSNAMRADFKCLEATPTSIRQAGGVNTPNTTGNYDISRLAPGAIGRAAASPSQNNTGT